MIYATSATALIGVGVLLVMLLAGVRIGVALGLVGIGGLAVILGPEAALIKSGVILVDTLTRYELGTLPLFLFMAGVAMAFSGPWAEDGVRPDGARWLKVLRRSLVLWVLGMVCFGCQPLGVWQ